MKRTYLCIIIILLSVSQIHSQNISMDDFRIPESQYKNLIGGMNGSFGNRNYGEKSTENAYVDADINLTANTLNGFDSESESFTLRSYSRITYGQNSKSESMHSLVPFTRKESSKGEAMNIDLSGKYSTYLVPDAFYLFGSSSFSGYYDFNRIGTDTNDVHERSSFYKERRVNGTLEGGIGYGKMRDASAIFSAIRIIEKLSEDGFLTTELNKEEILTVANIVTVKNVYTATYDRPKKYLLDDIVNALLAMGVVKENRISAYEVARIDEVFQEYFSPWMIGWKIETGVQLNRSQTEAIYDIHNYLTKDFSRSDFNGIVVNGSYGKAFSLNLHWLASVVFTVPVYNKIKNINKNVNSVLTYLVSEKFNNELSVRYSTSKLYYDDWARTTSENNFSIANTMRYFIENNISFYFTTYYGDAISSEQNNGITDRKTSNGFTGYFGLNYRFY